MLALSLLADGNAALAREAAERGLRLRPGDPDFLKIVARTYEREGRFADAERAIGLALDQQPDDPVLVAVASDIRFRAGDFEGASGVLEPLIRSGTRVLAIALSFARVAPRLKRQHEAIALLESGMEEQDSILPQRIMALFAIGDLYDELGEYDAAFSAYLRGNSLRGRRSDEQSYFASIDRMLAAWTPARLAASSPAAASCATDPAPVFIVGMPRSGTSLTEQILAMHPAVFGGGEREVLNRLVRELQHPFGDAGLLLANPEVLTPKVVDRIGRTALRDLHALAPDASRIIDKNPVNYLHLGLISRVFPGASILHCVRDPLDTCLSCFLHNLAGPHVFAGDLALMGRWFKAYKRTMEHWRAIPGVRIMDVTYEDMVADQEGVTRRMVDFLGLDWRQEMLRFHTSGRPTLTPSVDQVRRPMYSTSVGRWRNYEKHLAPLREVLGM